MSEVHRMICPDTPFFVGRLHQAVEAIGPWVARSIGTRVGFDFSGQFKAVSSHEVYLHDVHKKLIDALRSRTINHEIASRLLEEIRQK